MATVTETHYNAGSGPPVFVGSGWAVVTTANASSGGYQMSLHAGDTCTFAFSGRALFLLCTMLPNSQSPGNFTATIDGVTQPGFFSCRAFTIAGNVHWRSLINIATGLTDGAHTLVITVVGGGNVTVDGFFSITGALSVATPNVYSAIGDSITLGAGPFNGVVSGYVNQLVQLLQMHTGKTITAHNYGVSGDCMFAASSTQFGGMYRTASSIGTDTPQYLTLLYGANDLANGQCASYDFLRYIDVTCQFIEQVMDKSCVYAWGTPPYRAAGARMINNGIGLIEAPREGFEWFEQNVAAVRRVLSLYSRCRIANIYETLACVHSGLFPNSQGDFGIHPSEGMATDMAIEFMSALLDGNHL